MEKPFDYEQRAAAAHNAIVAAHDPRRVAAILEVIRPVIADAKAADNIVAAALMVGSAVSKLDPAGQEDVLAAFCLLVVNLQVSSAAGTTPSA